MRAVFLLAEGHQTLDHPPDAPIEDRVALPEERVVRDIQATKRFQDAREDRLPDFPDVFRQLSIAALESLGEPFDLVLQRGVALELGARLLVQLHVAVLDPLPRIRRVLAEMSHGPIEQDHLAADVIHEVFARDVVAGHPHEANEGVAQKRVAGPAHMQRAGGVRARVLEEDPFLPSRRRPIRFAIGPDPGEDQLREGCRVHGEVHVRALGSQRSERRPWFHARCAVRDRGR